MAGKSRVLIGLQYGDEGKVRVMDKKLDGEFSDTNIVARFNGGPNAGHTIKKGNLKIALHQVPGGVFYPNMKLYTGSGCVLNPVKLVGEINEIHAVGIDVSERLFISPNVPLIQPHHIFLDKIHGKSIGTTSNGIGQAYSDQALRKQGNRLIALRFADYLSDRKEGQDVIRENILDAAEKYGVRVSSSEIETLINDFDASMVKLEPRLVAPTFLQDHVANGANVTFEGAQSTMLDNIVGSYPNVTSSRTLAAAAYTGGDLPIKYHDKTIAVAKAIASRVGNGPFVSEFGGRRSELHCDEKNENGETRYVREVEFSTFDPAKLLSSDDLLEIGIALRMIDGEYGATTKRPRRVGMLDLVMLRQNCLLNGVDELYINKFDSLFHFSKTGLQGIPVVTAYDLNGKTIDYMPTTNKDLSAAKPVIEYMRKFPYDISGFTKQNQLPEEVDEMVRFIEGYVGVPVKGIGTGPERDQFVTLN